MERPCSMSSDGKSEIFHRQGQQMSPLGGVYGFHQLILEILRKESFKVHMINGF